MTKWSFLPVFVAILALGCTSVTPALEAYRGHAFVRTAGAWPTRGSTGANPSIQISISRWTTDDERQLFSEAFRSGGSEALRTALTKAEETGFVLIEGRSTYRLRYARASEVDGSRQIVLATDRPISFGAERDPGSRTRDYEVTIIVLNVDEAGSGSGGFSVGTGVTFDSEVIQLDRKHYSTEPVTINNISRID